MRLNFVAYELNTTALTIDADTTKMIHTTAAAVNPLLESRYYVLNIAERRKIYFII